MVLATLLMRIVPAVLGAYWAASLAKSFEGVAPGPVIAVFLDTILIALTLIAVDRHVLCLSARTRVLTANFADPCGARLASETAVALPPLEPAQRYVPGTSSTNDDGHPVLIARYPTLYLPRSAVLALLESPSLVGRIGIIQ